MNSPIEKSLSGVIPKNELKGVYTALITPRNSNGRIDYKKIEMLIDDQINAGVDGIVAAGTTGQSPAFSHKSQATFVERIFRYIDGRTKLIPNGGSNDTDQAIDLTKRIEDKIGPATFLSVVPYYCKPDQEDMIDHFLGIAESLGKGSDIILYNVPSRTGVNMEAETTMDLAHYQKISGIKEASGNLKQVEEIIKGTDGLGFSVLSGEDHIVADIVKIGGTGVISASANIAPKPFKEIVYAGLRGDHETAKRIQEWINPLVKEGIFYAANPKPLAHIFNTHLKSPLGKRDRIEKQVMSVLSQYDPKELGIDWNEYRIE